MSQSWNPEERLEKGVSQIQSIAHRASAEDLLLEMRRRTRHRNRRRMRLTYTLSAACVVGIGAVAMLLPGKAEASSFEKVIRNAKGRSIFFKKEYSLIKSAKWASESTMEQWQFADRQVTRVRQRQATMALVPGDRLEDHAFYGDTLWINPDATTLCYNPDFHAAMKYNEGQQSTFDLSQTLSQIAQEGKIAGPQKGVTAHGGTFDEYELETAQAKTSIKKRIYVDPQSQMVRFIDTIAHSEENDFETSIEMLYPTAAELAQTEPKLPPGYPVVNPDELKNRFTKEIQEPVETKTVGGIKVTLYGVVIRAPGDIRAITTGGAPRDYQDTTHELLVLDHPTWVFRDRPWPVGPLTQIPDPDYRIGNRRVISPYRIAGKEYVVESSRRVIRGEVPKEITIRVPVWKYDRTHPLKGMDRTFYPSRFVGYVTFKTNKIYEMPGGISNGGAAAQLPDRYAPGDPANQVAVGIEK